MDATTFKDAKVIKQSEHFVNIKLNLTKPTQAAQRFAQQHGIRGVPTIIFLDPQGKEVLGNFVGYRPADAYYQEMQDVLDFVKLRKQYEKTPEDITLNLKLALAYLHRNRLEDAEPMIQRVLEADPDNARGFAIQIYHARALSRLAQGQFDEAKQDIDRVASWDSEGKYLPELHFQMGFELGNRNQMDSAVTYFEKVYREYPKSESADKARFYAGLVYFLQEKDAQALPLLRDYAQNGKDAQLREYAQNQLKKLEDRMK